MFLRILIIATLFLFLPLHLRAQESENYNPTENQEEISPADVASTPEVSEETTNEEETKAAPTPSSELNLGLGTMTQNFRKVQTTVGGDKNNFKFDPYLSAAIKYPLSPQFSLLPSFGMTIPRKSEKDDNITKFTYYFLAEAAFHLNSDLSFKAGPGLSFNYLSGSGGEKILNNGTSSSSFPVPAGSATTRNLIFSLGGDYRFFPHWALQIQTLFFNPHDSISRSITYTLSILFYFDLPKFKE